MFYATNYWIIQDEKLSKMIETLLSLDDFSRREVNRHIDILVEDAIKESKEDIQIQTLPFGLQTQVLIEIPMCKIKPVFDKDGWNANSVIIPKKYFGLEFEYVLDTDESEILTTVANGIRIFGCKKYRLKK